MTSRSRARGPIKVALVSAAVLAFTSGCGSSGNSNQADTQEMVQCVDENDNVVDDDRCDDDGDGHGGGGYFVFLNGSARHPHGTHLDRSHYTRDRVRYNDAAARTSAGLAPSGKVTGSRTVSNAGIGKGSTGGGTGSTGS